MASVYAITVVGRLNADVSLRDQMRRAAVSIMSNIAERFERGRASQFHQFLSIAKASCAELRSQLHLVLDAGYIDQETFERLRRQAEELVRIVAGLRAAVERQRDHR